MINLICKSILSDGSMYVEYENHGKCIFPYSKLEKMKDEVNIILTGDINYVSNFLDNLPDFITRLEINDVKGLENFDSSKYYSKFDDLEILTFRNNPDLKSIRISENMPVENLAIFNNQQLDYVNFEKLNSLQSFDFYGNYHYRRVDPDNACGYCSPYFSFLEFVKNNPNIEYNLDVRYYKDIINVLPQTNLRENCNWSELIFPKYTSSGLVPVTYGQSEMKRLYNWSKKIVDTYTFDSDTDIEKYAALYKWMMENVKYDDEALKKDKVRKHTDEHTGKEIGHRSGTNGTYNGIMYGHCVCQGYTRSLNFLLDLVGIECYDVSCKVPVEEEEKNPYHSMQVGYLNYEGKRRVFYSDNTYDASGYTTAKEMSERYARTYVPEYFSLDRQTFLDQKREFLDNHLYRELEPSHDMPVIDFDYNKKKNLFKLMEERFERIEAEGKSVKPARMSNKNAEQVNKNK